MPRRHGKREQYRRSLWKTHSRKQATELGNNLEDRVEVVLKRFVTEGFISSFVKHAKHSPADLRGRDFTVRRGPEVRHFGVTTSLMHGIQSQGRHGVLVIHIHPSITEVNQLLRLELEELFLQPADARPRPL